LRQGTQPAVYLPFAQLKFWGDMTFYVRTSQRPEAVMGAIRKVLSSVDRDLPIMNMRTETEQVASSLSQERLFAALTSFFALLSVVLGGIGVYGVTQFGVVRRTNEIGIRMALGAQQRAVVGSILREGFTLALVGLVLGTATAVALTRLIASFLYGVGRSDFLTFASVALVLSITTLIAVWQPARGAAKISPLQALRHE
jgi:ABC-type antimicrobial peptide transport system permease subunit